MKINACIYNKNGFAQGCITNSVLNKFSQEFDALYKKYRDTDYSFVLDVLNQILQKSQKDSTAQFLNGLKLIVRKYNHQFELQFLQDVSKAYHNLVRYVCSVAVQQEVFDNTITIFRENGIDYKGKDVQGVNDDECAFEYDGLLIGIKIRNKSDLYNLWNNKNNEITAVVYAGSEKYIISECSFEIIILAIKACVQDYKYHKQDNLQNIVNELLSIAEMFVNNRNC